MKKKLVLTQTQLKTLVYALDIHSKAYDAEARLFLEDSEQLAQKYKHPEFERYYATRALYNASDALLVYFESTLDTDTRIIYKQILSDINDNEITLDLDTFLEYADVYAESELS